MRLCCHLYLVLAVVLYNNVVSFRTEEDLSKVLLYFFSNLVIHPNASALSKDKFPQVVNSLITWSPSKHYFILDTSLGSHC